MLSAAAGAKPIATATPFVAPQAQSSGHGGHSHGDDVSCGNPAEHMKEGFFIETDFRGDLEGDACITIELAIGESNAAIWREVERTTELIKPPSLGGSKNKGMKPAIGIQSTHSKDSLNTVLRTLSKPGIKSLSGILIGSDAYNADSSPKTDTSVVEIPEILGINLQYAKNSTGAVFCSGNRGDSVSVLDPVALIDIGTGDHSFTLRPEQLTALFLAHWTNAIDVALAGDLLQVTNKSKKESKKKSKVKRDGMTLVVPNSFGYPARKELIMAAGIAGSNIRNIFSRGLAAVAGSLQPNRTLLGALKSLSSSSSRPNSTDTSNHIVLVVLTTDCDVDISIVSCEKNPKLNKIGKADRDVNSMGYDRLVSLVHLGIRTDRAESAWLEGTISEIVRDTLVRTGGLVKVCLFSILFFG